jgi:hypothetical protein
MLAKAIEVSANRKLGPVSATFVTFDRSNIGINTAIDLAHQCAQDWLLEIENFRTPPGRVMVQTTAILSPKCRPVQPAHLRVQPPDGGRHRN